MVNNVNKVVQIAVGITDPVLFSGDLKHPSCMGDRLIEGLKVPKDDF